MAINGRIYKTYFINVLRRNLSMYDIHSHVLPGIDDGAVDIEASIEICRAAFEEGITTIVATPHYISGESEIEKSKLLTYISLINQELKTEDIDLLVLPGMEIYITPNLYELYQQGKIITLNCKNYMLIELPLYNSLPAYLYNVIFNLEIKGIKPVIAHPERCKAVIDHPSIVNSLIDKKCIIQVNSGSIEGLYGKDAQRTANYLLENNMVHVIASDCHSIKGRKSLLKDSYNIVAKKYGARVAQDLFVANAYRIISGESIVDSEPVEVRKKKMFGLFRAGV